ncbi:methylamine dehydrogenase [Sphingomonas oleivorans]|uniref:Methylamine dehydrogenase n=1 Tax=Sphingomonas oleivorans TaxID=1735121 RepID=A0A2T5FZ30_9SPHN|nr:amine dehydrogenase large subunit [Sphingomonas oleivorans]PTQ11821.1 methylamine dehydrogenase [Sphingomonas oleivorans]
MLAAVISPVTLQAESVVPQIEESDVATLPPLSPHMLLLTGDGSIKGTRIIDGDSGKILGTIHTQDLTNVRIAPDGAFFYVAETIWTRGNRGVRQDLLTIYDARTLKIVDEIDLPGRLLVGNRRQTFEISADGRHAFIYNMDPASSVIVVDLARRKVARTIEIPGCALVFAGAAATISSLCGDGTLSTIGIDARQSQDLTPAQPFFSAEDDPIFDNSIADPKSGKAIFLSYSGLVYTATLAPGQGVDAPWSLQQAAGMSPASTRPLEVSWLPGGRQLIAYHRATGTLYVLMHMGEFWSHKEDGKEIWVVDVANRKVLRRHRLAEPVSHIQVSQDDAPLLFLNIENKLVIVDAKTFEEKKSLDNVGNGMMMVPGE